MRRVLFAVVMLAALASASCKRELALKPGDELFSILDEAVLEVSLRAADQRVDARRFQPDEPLYFSFERDRGARFVRCVETERLANALKPMYDVRVRSVLSDEKGRAKLAAHKPKRWVELTVRDIMREVEPFSLLLLKDEDGSVYAHLPGEHVVFTVDPKILGLLELGCDMQAAEAP